MSMSENVSCASRFWRARRASRSPITVHTHTHTLSFFSYPPPPTLDLLCTTTVPTSIFGCAFAPGASFFFPFDLLRLGFHRVVLVHVLATAVHLHVVLHVLASHVQSSPDRTLPERLPTSVPRAYRVALHDE